MVDTAVDTETEMSQALKLEVSGLAEDFFRSLTKRELEHLPYWWEFWARPKQIAPPGNWTYWLMLAGRGFGKTRSLSEWVIRKAREMPGSRGAIVGQTAGDVRDVLIEGESGILACSPPDFMPEYVASKRRLTWPNGTVATLFSAEKPDSMRGPQFHWAAVDELAAWRYEDAWSMLQFGLRLGDNPQCAIATTPRPTPVIRGLVSDPHCVVTHGTTYENRANLAASFFEQIIRKYEGTRLGRQELLAHILDDTPGALWNRDMLDATRVLLVPKFERIVVAIDPAATTGTTGIVVIGVAKDGRDLHGYVLDDVTPEAGVSPATWAATAVAAYSKWQADSIVAEANQGGEMVRHTIHTVPGGDKIRVKLVRATRGKYTRAEPVGALFEQGRAHMVGMLAKLEDELCTWVPGEDSPNRLDAMVWGFTETMIDNKAPLPAVAPTGMGKISKWGN